jgi:hypothetical protein
MEPKNQSGREEVNEGWGNLPDFPGVTKVDTMNKIQMSKGYNALNNFRLPLTATVQLRNSAAKIQMVL